jgi:hypothetical protein
MLFCFAIYNYFDYVCTVLEEDCRLSHYFPFQKMLIYEQKYLVCGILIKIKLFYLCGKINILHFIYFVLIAG